LTVQVRLCLYLSGVSQNSVMAVWKVEVWSGKSYNTVHFADRVVVEGWLSGNICSLFNIFFYHKYNQQQCFTSKLWVRTKCSSSPFQYKCAYTPQCWRHKVIQHCQSYCSFIWFTFI
jgi:hypothetical protein